jgi:hypothetical protein
MCDCSDAECNTLQSVFPAAQIYLCDFHREQAWTCWVRNSKQGLTSEEETLLRMLHRIASAPPGKESIDGIYRLRVEGIYFVGEITSSIMAGNK